MSNRQHQQYEYGFLRKVIRLYPVVSVGAAGAVTLKKRQLTAAGAGSAAPAYSLVAAPTSGTPYAYGDQGGIRKVVRNDTGDWTFTLTDPYLCLVGVRCIQVSNATGLITSPLGGVGVLSGSTNVQTNTATGDGGTIRVVLNNGSGAAADPADGDTLTFEIVLGDSTGV